MNHNYKAASYVWAGAFGFVLVQNVGLGWRFVVVALIFLVLTTVIGYVFAKARKPVAWRVRYDQGHGHWHWKYGDGLPPMNTDATPLYTDE